MDGVLFGVPGKIVEVIATLATGDRTLEKKICVYDYEYMCMHRICFLKQKSADHFMKLQMSG